MARTVPAMLAAALVPANRSGMKLTFGIGGGDSHVEVGTQPFGLLEEAAVEKITHRDTLDGAGKPLDRLLRFGVVGNGEKRGIECRQPGVPLLEGKVEQGTGGLGTFWDLLWLELLGGCRQFLAEFGDPVGHEVSIDAAQRGKELLEADGGRRLGLGMLHERVEDSRPWSGRHCAVRSLPRRSEASAVPMRGTRYRRRLLRRRGSWGNKVRLRSRLFGFWGGRGGT